MNRSQGPFGLKGLWRSRPTPRYESSSNRSNGVGAASGFLSGATLCQPSRGDMSIERTRPLTTQSKFGFSVLLFILLGPVLGGNC